MLAHAEARGQAGAVDRRAHQRAAHGSALGRVEVGAAVGALIVEELGAAARQRHGGEQQLARAHHGAVVVDEDLIEELEGVALLDLALEIDVRSEEHTSELQSLMRISYAVFCLKKK